MFNVYLSVSVLVISCLVCFSYLVLASNNEQNIYGTAVDTHAKIGLKDESAYSSVSLNSGINGNQNENNKMSNSNLYSNPPFVFLDNNSGTIRLGLPSFWKDQK